MNDAEAKALILGVQVSSLTVPQIMGRLAEWVQQDQPRNIFYVNAHSLNLAWQDNHLRNLLNRADLVYPDGISVVWSAQYLFGCRMQKITGADWVHDYCQQAAQFGWRTYILGGRPGVASQASANLLIKYPGLQIVGHADGFFQAKSVTQVLDEIHQTEAQVVFVGMGTPQQEMWIDANREAIRAPVCWAVGAMLDFVAGTEPRAPRLVRALALEWFWRLCMDPRGKWRRYILGNPLFVYRVLRQHLDR